MHKIHIPNLGVEPSIFNWLSVSPLPARKPPKDRSTYKCTSSTTEERAEKDANFKPSLCPSGAEEKAEMSCMDKNTDFETICPLGEVEVYIEFAHYESVLHPKSWVTFSLKSHEI